MILINLETRLCYVQQYTCVYIPAHLLRVQVSLILHTDCSIHLMDLNAACMKILTGTGSRSFNVSITSLPFFSQSLFSGPVYLPVISSLLSPPHFLLYIKIGSAETSSESILMIVHYKETWHANCISTGPLSIIPDTVWHDIESTSPFFLILLTHICQEYLQDWEGREHGAKMWWINSLDLLHRRGTQSNNHINELKYV